MESSIAFPYQCLTALGSEGVLCASRGGSIFTFGADGLLLSSWHHPKSAHRKDADTPQAAHQSGEGNEEVGLPSKKRKLNTGESQNADDGDQNGEGTEATNVDGKKQKPKVIKRDTHYAQEQALVILLRSTPTASHVIAVTGQDKTVWVFEHDGKGHLKELSQRTMPKRPCDLTITPDNKTLLVADKFGDVYAVPLIPSADHQIETSSGHSTPRNVEPFVSKGASALTVHSQRNLKALEDQKKQREKRANEHKEVGPTFEHELLFGHVSMLTAVATASSRGRNYILTADRDEHIRVSRGLPQAHIIENFCLGHTAFINALCLPRPEILVSGGGDDELYVWDWCAGVVKSKVDLLSLVQAVTPGATKLAVSGLYAYDSEAGPMVLAICERVPAVFVFSLSGETLAHSQTLNLSSNPLDLAVTSCPSNAIRLTVAVDTSDSAGLVTFEWSQGHWECSTGVPFAETRVPDEPTPGRAELNKILYNVENLRKTDFNDAEDGETPLPESDVGSIAA